MYFNVATRRLPSFSIYVWIFFTVFDSAVAPAPGGKTASASKKASSPPKGECIPSKSDHSSFYCLNPLASSLSNKPQQQEGEEKHLKAAMMCVDTNDLCKSWQERGECKGNPQYMLINCAKSCDSCINLHSGVTQVAPDLHSFDQDSKDAFVKRLVATQEYVQDQLHTSVAFLKTCKNNHELCTHWATNGKCSSDLENMQDMCPAVCRLC